jgi:hypothetical protein
MGAWFDDDAHIDVEVLQPAQRRFFRPDGDRELQRCMRALEIARQLQGNRRRHRTDANQPGLELVRVLQELDGFFFLAEEALGDAVEPLARRRSAARCARRAETAPR